MASLTLLVTVITFVTVSDFPSCGSQEPRNLTVKPGDDANLSCVDPKHGIHSMFNWIRRDLKPEGCVYFNRERLAVTSFQDPSFRGRVDLKDPNMKDGDMSVILRNVTLNDTATYDCLAITGNSGRRKRSEPELISTVNLKVEDSGPTPGNIWGEKDNDGGDKFGNRRGHIGLIVSLSVFGPALVVVLVMCIRKKT